MSFLKKTFQKLTKSLDKSPAGRLDLRVIDQEKKAKAKVEEAQQNALIALQNQQAANLKRNLSEDLGLDNTATVIAGGEGTLSEVEMLRKRRSPLAATLSSTLGIR